MSQWPAEQGEHRVGLLGEYPVGMGSGRERKPWRVFGMGGAGSNPDRDRFEELTVAADAAGVAWRDLTEDGYRVAGDMYIGGMLVSYDWRWRAAELERRLALPHD